MTAERPRRRALLLGCGTYLDRSLAPLRSPPRDVKEFRRVLVDPDIGCYSVTAKVDCTSQDALRSIEAFFSGARVSDAMNLLYLSCHGVQDAQGRLYFAFSDTERGLLSSTAVSADWVRDRIYASRSKATVVLVDCCFSGAFIKGMRARSATATNIESLVRDLPEGSGVAVLTASGETEVSFEDADSPEVRPSYFTEALIKGIATGAADLNRDGRITVDELYDYVYDRVVSGPSTQRPRRLGMGEGALVISDAAQRLPSKRAVKPPPASLRPAQTRPTPLVAKGVLGWVSFDGEWIVIGKSGVGHVYKGERRYHISRLSGVAVKLATHLYHGYFQVILAGISPVPVARIGLQAGRPPLTDDNSVSFARAANDDFCRIRDAVQAAISAGQSPSRAATSSVGHPADDPSQLVASVEVRADAGRSQPGRLPGESSTLPDGRPYHGDAADPGEYNRGATDGARFANRLPLTALADLLGNQFDVLRWLAPWRERGSRIAGIRTPTAAMPSWLPNLAQYLGSYAAPSGSTNSLFTPSHTYLMGFCSGLRWAWREAVSAGLVPADGYTLANWINQPSNRFALPKPLAEATLNDLRIAQRRSRRGKLIRWTLRPLLWIAIAFLVLMEIAAIAISIDGGWTDVDGQPADNQAIPSLVASLGCLLPLIGLVGIAVVDIYVSRKQKQQRPGGH